VGCLCFGYVCHIISCLLGITYGIVEPQRNLRPNGGGVPVGFTLDNFKRVLGMFTAEQSVAMGGTATGINFWLYLRNSVIVSTLLVAGQTFFSAMSALCLCPLTLYRARSTLFLVFDGDDDSWSCDLDSQLHFDS
jgi:ABC-type glycerol-3-phosphate transport system permease component